MCSSDVMTILDRLGSAVRTLSDTDLDTLSDRELATLVEALDPVLARLKVQEARLIGAAHRRGAGPR